MTDDRHKRHSLRQGNVIHLVHQGDTVPAEWDADIPSMPAWAKPVPRRSRDSYCTPLIQWERKHHLIRHLCARVPLLKPVARLIF